MSLVSIDWRPDSRRLRRFGATVLVGCGLIGLALFFAADRAHAALAVWIAGAVIGLLGLTGAKMGLPGYWLWMGIAFVAGNIVSRLLLAVVYFGLFAPMGAIMRLCGRDSLALRRRPSATYWKDLAPTRHDDPARYERQF